MSITREEAIAEAQRRGLIPKEEGSSQSITREEALAEAKRRGLIIPQESNSWTESPAMSAIYGIAEPFDKLAHGILQPLLENKNSPEFLRNASQSVGEGNRVLNRRSEELNPLSHMFGNIGGEIALNAPAMALGAPGGAGLLRSTLGKPGWMGLLSNILKGGIGGGLRGAAEYAGEDESRLENALSKAIGGAAAGALPSAFGAAKGAVNYGKNLKNAYPVEKVANKIVSDRNAIRGAYKKGYGEFFEQAAESGANKVKVPNIRLKNILNNSTKNESHALKEFLSNPSVKTAHNAQSDLGKVIRRLDKINETTGLKTPQIRALEAAKDAQKRIRGSMFESFEKSGNPNLTKRYSELTEGYRKEVLPYTKNKSINSFLRKELTPSDFVKKVGNEKKFKAQLLPKYPEIEARKSFPAMATGLGIGSGGIYGASKILPYLFGNNE